MSNKGNLSEVKSLQPSINENSVLPLGSFVLPQAYVQGLMESHLEPVEMRMIREINRLEVWVQNLQTQLNAAHERIKYLTPVDRDQSQLAAAPPE